jgi:hypothetical protein
MRIGKSKARKNKSQKQIVVLHEFLRYYIPRAGNGGLSVFSGRAPFRSDNELSEKDSVKISGREIFNNG